MSRVFYIHDERGKRRLDANALPLKLGGKLQGDIVMHATPADVLLAYIAYSEGHVYIQPADSSVQLFHNHVRLSGSAWLKSGDQVQTAEAVLSWQVQGDEITVTTQPRRLAGDLSPPAEPPPSSPQRSLPDVATTPPARVSKRRAVLAVFVLLLLATAFVLLATPVLVQITPEPDRQSLSGFPPVVTIGDRRLALPGRYTVHASREGHYPLQETIDVVMGGLQDALMSFDFGQLVIDDEIAQMIKHVRKGFDFSKESVSLDEIKATGPAGMFSDNSQTLERMMTGTFMPDLASRKLREQWAAEGSSTIRQRAMDKALGILSNPNAAALDAEVDARIRAAFEGLVKGDSVLPEGWTRVLASTAPTRLRRVNRRRRG